MTHLPTISVINMGCPKNRVDAEIILAELVQAGYNITGDSRDADVVIVNTCGFLEEAVEESAEVIAQQQERRRSGELKKLLVTGCLPQRVPRELVGRFPWVDAFVGLDAVPEIPVIIKETAKPGQVFVTPLPSWNPGREFPRLLSTPEHYAYLRLTEGCSNNCSYCTIPTIRGPMRLREVDDIIGEARDLAGLGSRELILIAQDTAAHPELAGILKQLTLIDELCWIRVLYAHPAHLSEQVLATMAQNDKVLNYIDMPVQHLAHTVLGRMNRRCGYAKIRDLVKKSRELNPGFALRTTVMVGFPGETDEEFDELMAGLEELRFTHTGIFVYSQEQGTPAADMPDQIPREVREKRAVKVAELAQRLRAEEIKKMMGSTQEAVVDYAGEDGAVGRLWSDAPEIDRVVAMEGDVPGPGTFGKVEITGGEYDRISARWIEPSKFG